MPDGAPTSIQVGVETANQSISLGDAVVRLEIEDHDRLIDEARITLDDTFDLAGAHLENGFKVVIMLGWEAELVTVFTGEIVRIGGQMAATSGGTTIVVHDPSVRMHRANQHLHAQPGETLSALVRRVVTPYSDHFTVDGIECDPDPTFESANLPRQLERTDFEFLQYLASTWGARCFVEVNDDQPKFYFKSIQTLWAADPVASLQLCRGYGALMSFRYERIAARATRQLVSSSMDPVTGQTVTADSGPVPAAAAAGGGLSASVRTAEPGIAASQEQLAGAVAAETRIPDQSQSVIGGSSDAARTRNYVIVDPTQASGLRAEARSVGHVDLRAKGRVSFSGMAPWAEGDWWVKRVTHTVVPRRRTGDSASTSYECELEVTR